MSDQQNRSTEEKLRANETLFRFISEHVEDVIWTADIATGKFTYLSPSVQKLRGYSPEECMQQTIADALLPHSLETANAMLANAIGSRKPGDDSVFRFLAQLDQRRKDGSSVPTEVACSLIFDEQGRPLRLIGVTRDITERKQAEEAIAAEKERLATTLRSIGDGVITTDVQGNVVIVNRAAEELTGWTQTDAIGHPLEEVFCIVDETTGAPCENPVANVLSRREVTEMDSRTVLVSRDGTRRNIADSGSPILNADGGIIGVVLVFRDVTEKRILMETLQRTDKLDAIGVLAGGIAHDFNNLLAGIFGYIHLADRRCDPDSEVSRLLHNALSVLSRARNLTQQMLTFSKGGAPIRRRADLRLLVRESTAFALSGSNVSSEFHLAPDLALCDVDVHQIAQVIDNLVINAKQAMPEGGMLKVEASNVDRDGSGATPAPGRYVKISISDTGDGIPASLQQRIFDPFFTTKPGGNGLGLATSHAIVQKHDGHMEVTSTVGEGSTFHIYLPVSTEAHDDAAGHAAVVHRGEGLVLLMDDESFILELTGEMIASMGYRVITGREGREILAFAQQLQSRGEVPICAVLDLTIPGGMGGRETVRGLHRLFPHLPVFASSGYSEDPVMAHPAQFEFIDSIPKPYVLEELMVLFNRHLTHEKVATDEAEK